MEPVDVIKRIDLRFVLPIMGRAFLPKETKEEVKALEAKGVPFTLRIVPEPENPFDENAIRVEVPFPTESIKLGYVPRGRTLVLKECQERGEITNILLTPSYGMEVFLRVSEISRARDIEQGFTEDQKFSAEHLVSRSPICRPSVEVDEDGLEEDE